MKTAHVSDTEESDEDISDDEDRDDASDTAMETSADESSEESEEDEKKGMYVTQLFRDMVQEVVEENEEELSVTRNELIEKGVKKRRASKLAILNSDASKKALRQLFVKNMHQIEEHIRHPLYKAIIKKVEDFVDDGLNLSEAIDSAVKYRKHALYNLINYL